METTSALHLPGRPCREISRHLCMSLHFALQSLHSWDTADPCSPCGMGSSGSPSHRMGAAGPSRLSRLWRSHQRELFGASSAQERCSHMVNQHEFTPGYLLFNCSFLLPISANGRCARSLSPSRHIYDLGEVGQGERSSNWTPTDPAFLGLFLLVSSAPWLLTCPYLLPPHSQWFDISSSGPGVFSL